MTLFCWAKISSIIKELALCAISPHRWVEIGFAQPGPVFYVRDNGIGIAEKQQQTVFGIFRRLHGKDAYGGGAGAGLSIVKKMVERHGGKIWLESAPGEGATFFFTLCATDGAAHSETGLADCRPA